MSVSAGQRLAPVKPRGVRHDGVGRQHRAAPRTALKSRGHYRLRTGFRICRLIDDPCTTLGRVLVPVERSFAATVEDVDLPIAAQAFYNSVTAPLS